MEDLAVSWLEPGRTCWRVETARRFAYLRDGAEYFRVARAAMAGARHSILLIGWDFDARIRLGEKGDPGPESLGEFVLWLARHSPGLEIRLLRWGTGALKTLLRGNTLLTVLRWRAHPRITLRLDGAHPFGGSHHQKIVVIDDAVAFCGGIDMTAGRWDTPDHADGDPRRLDPGGRPYGPWHDATAVFDGPAAVALGDLARARWLAATGEVLAPPPAPAADLWPAGLRPDFTDAALGIARTLPAWRDSAAVHEIEAGWLEMIARARRWIYLEGQYFASRRIARAIAERLVAPDPPEVVVVNPQSLDGWLEPLAMDTARARLVKAIRAVDRQGRFRIYCPVTEAGAPIFVHAKAMIIDDDCLRVGSSNVNNRSMRFDSECDVMLPAEGPEAAAIAGGIAGLRNRLLAEHLGAAPEEVAARLEATGSLIGTIEALRGPGRSLVPYEVPELNGFQSWIAENEILDPASPEEVFEPLSRRGLFRGWDKVRLRLRIRSRAPKGFSSSAGNRNSAPRRRFRP